MRNGALFIIALLLAMALDKALPLLERLVVAVEALAKVAA